jgi:hypothetical protein|tara:strand:- start:1713 stop:4343 length:2631 start_codon:yes stop_codon:yes gene_type:complete
MAQIYSKFVTKSAAVLGKTAPPSDVTFNVPEIRPSANAIYFSWPDITDVDFKEYIIQKAPSGGSWETTLSNNTEVFRGKTNNWLYTADTISLGSMVFLIKAVDTSGIYSTNATSRTVTIAAATWSSQTISHTIEDGQLTITWPKPGNSQFDIASYQVKYRTGNSSTSWSGAVATGHGTTEGVFNGANTLTFPVTWGKGSTGSTADYRTFIVKAVDLAGNESGNEISKSIQINPPTVLSVAHSFIQNDEGTKADARVFWTAPTISTSQLPIAHYKVFYQDYKTGATPTVFASRGSPYLSELGTTEFKQEVDWGPTVTNSNGGITTGSGTSADIRRYWVVPVDLAGNWGIAYSSGESDYIPDIEDVTVVRPNAPTGLSLNDYSTKSSNGVVEVTWVLPTVTTAPITSFRIFWELPTWNSTTNKLTSTRGEKNSKAGTASKYGTPVTWGPTNGSGETSRSIYIVSYDSIGNISLPAGISVPVLNPNQISAGSLTAQVIDNNVILRWSDPAATSLPIASYDIFRCPAAGTCTVSDYLSTSTAITNVGSTNTYSFFETAAGTYKYFVRTKDLAGNYATPQSISVGVSEPRDFEVLNEVDSKYNAGALAAGYCSGYVANNESTCEANGGSWIEASAATWANIEDESDTSAVLPINTTETWQQHFVNNSWATPQAQVTAGYTYFVKPEQTATYYQKWDMGTEIDSATISLSTTSEDTVATVASTPQLYYTNTESIFEVSDITNHTGWTPGIAGNTSLLASTFRYVKVKIEYNGSTNKGFKSISKQSISLGLGTVRDQARSDVAISVANKASGATVSFNKTFTDVNSITVTPKFILGGNENGRQNTAIYDFTDIANPSSFTVYLLDAQTGAFTNGTFTWQATGV